jgi:DNA-binding response OmpR family regulator
VEPSSETGHINTGFFCWRKRMLQTPDKNLEVQSQSIGIDLDETLKRDKKVLIVDDDSDTVELVKRILRLSDFDVASARNGLDALTLVEKILPDVIILDLMMPEIDGRTTLKKLREITHAPIIVLSALTEKTNIVDLLNLGSDDYITKPFHRDELIARIQAVLRRTKLLSVIDGVSIPEISLMVNFSKREVQYHGKLVLLSPKEYELIQLLANHLPHIVSYKEISEQIWGESHNFYKNRIKYLVHSIRDKFNLIKPGNEVILNASRVGYRIQTD